jgi:creatinine amidohydrolase
VVTGLPPGGDVRRWADQAWPDFRAGLVGGPGEEVGLVPVGATEQHGPHLPTGTDTLVATAVCEWASAATGAPVLPAVPVGASYGHGTDLPGTLSLPPEMLARVLVQYAEWAAYSDVRRLLFVNGHAGNGAAIGIALDHLRFHRPDLRAGSVDWWTSDPAVTAELTADGSDIHANRGETAMVLAIAPHLVRTERMQDADDPDRTPDLVFRYTAAALSTNGVTGRPSEATAELGQHLLGLAGRALARTVEAGRVEQPPLSAHRPRLPDPSQPARGLRPGTSLEQP